MDPMLSYDFDEIEYTVRQEIHATSARLNAALEDLRAQIAPLQATWTREAAEAYRVEQARWEQSAGGAQRHLVQPGQRGPRRRRRRRRHRPQRRQRLGRLARTTRDSCGPERRGARGGRTVLRRYALLRIGLGWRHVRCSQRIWPGARGA